MSAGRTPNDPGQTLMQAYESLAEMMTSYVAAATKSNSAAWQGMEDITRNLRSLMQDSVKRAVNASHMMLNAKTPQEAADTKAEFMKNCFDDALAGGSKLAEISLHAAKSTIDPLAEHASYTVTAAIKKAKTP